MNLDLLLPIIGGLFVMETLSVIAADHQLPRLSTAASSAWRRSTTTSRSVGWPETTVIVRFWILGGLFVALGLGIFYGDFLTVAKFT